MVYFRFVTFTYDYGMSLVGLVGVTTVVVRYLNCLRFLQNY